MIQPGEESGGGLGRNNGRTSELEEEERYTQEPQRELSISNGN